MPTHFHGDAQTVRALSAFINLVRATDSTIAKTTAHLEGLGDALKRLFPDAKRGCREAPLITNPDTGAKVNVPHNFIGALHLRIANPKYRGPTKNVLIGEDVRKFVREAATKPLKRQWEQLRAQRSV